MKKIPTRIEDYANDLSFYSELTVLRAQEVVAEAMEKKKVSYKELSKRTGLTEWYLKEMMSKGKIEKDHFFRIKTLGLIMACLGLEVEFTVKEIKS